MLYGASWATLHQVFICANVVPRVLRQHWKIFFPGNIVWSCLDNMAQGFFIYFVQCCPKKIKTTLKKVFLVRCCLQPQGHHYIGFFLWNIVPKVLRQHCTGFFLCNVIYSLLGNIAQGFYLCNVGQREFRQHWTRFFPVQCCLEPLEKHCTRLLPVQCWPMVNRQLFWVKEPIQCCNYQDGTTLHMNTVYSMLSKYVWDNVAQENYWCSVDPDRIVIYSLENNHIQC